MLEKTIKCPICNQSAQSRKTSSFNLNDTNVTDSRVTKNGSMIRRRRTCVCGSRFTTYEKISSSFIFPLKILVAVISRIA